MSHDRPKAEIFLVPGFLGFTKLGKLDYFTDVKPTLERALASRGIDAKVYVTDTVPAGSIHKRAQKLAQEIAANHDLAVDSVHLIGHSTGGLDIRLLLSPGSALDHDGYDTASMNAKQAVAYRDALSKVRSAIGVATPHYGAPIADIAVRVSFDQLLRLLGRVTETKLVSRPLELLLALVGNATKLYEKIDSKTSFLEWVGPAVLANDPGAVLEYLIESSVDVGALRNLTQEGTDLANAAIHDRPFVRYGSIITGTNVPHGPIGTDDPLLYVNTVLFRIARRIAERGNPDYPYSGRVDELQRIHAADLGANRDVGELTIDNTTSDGVVPTASQAYGEVLGIFASDHLDCVGDFPHVDRSGKNVAGWIRSGAAFSERRFELVWNRVADFLVDSTRASVGAGSTRAPTTVSAPATTTRGASAPYASDDASSIDADAPFETASTTAPTVRITKPRSTRPS